LQRGRAKEGAGGVFVGNVIDALKGVRSIKKKCNWSGGRGKNGEKTRYGNFEANGKGRGEK